MADTGFAGPIFVYGQSPYPGSEYNPDIGSSLFYAGAGIMDPRTPYTFLPGESQSAQDFGWFGFDNVTTINAVPYTASAVAIVASANPVTATLVNVSANSLTTGVYITSAMVNATNGQIDTNGGLGLVALDAFGTATASFSNGVMTITANAGMPITPGMIILTTAGTISQGAITSATQVMAQLTTTGASPVSQGYAGTYQTNSNLTATSGAVTLAFQTPQQCGIPTNIQTPSAWMWNPSALVGRAISITAAAGATYVTATISGYDIYGYPMTEALTITVGGVTTGKKAWKYIKSVVLSGGSADTTHAYSVGTVDIIGLPLRADTFGELLVNAATSLTASTLLTAATGFVPADRTTSSTTTGDVRGTMNFTAGGANIVTATATNRYTIKQSVQAYNAQYTTGLFGVPQT